MPGPEPENPFAPADAALLALGEALRDADYRFSTVTPLTQARVNRRDGNAWARDLVGVFGWSRPFMAGLLPDGILRLMERAAILVPCGEGWRCSLRCSSLDSLLFFHSAYPTMAGDAVFFGPDTCRFVNAIRAHVASVQTSITRAVDIGCGAGPGGIVIARLRPGAEVLMVDINDAALRLARVNAALNAASNAVAQHSDLLTGAAGSFDLIVSNPPYLIDAAARAYRHGGGHRGEGLSVSILQAALPRLRPGGLLVLYTGAAIVDGHDGFRRAAEAVLAPRDFAWTYAEIDPDVFGEELAEGAYADADRIAAVVLTVT